MMTPLPTRPWRCFLLAIWAVLASAVLLSCSAEPDSPETQVRALLARAEVAAEGKDLAAFRQLVSDSYTDGRGHNKQAILGILAYHFFRNQSIHLLTRTQAITVPKPAQAEATVLVATAG
ncbi:MAG: hypothetical protein ACE5IQ_02795 [Candidatus Methylomirabilales bacterium]